MEDSKEVPFSVRSSTSRSLFPAGNIAGSTSSLGLVSGGATPVEDVDEDEDLGRLCTRERSFHTKLKAAASGHRSSGEVSLREWLDKPRRPVDFLECLHIFRQIIEAVNLAHCERVVVNNIRPSCFVMSKLNRVSFIESASGSGSGSDSSGEEGGGGGAFERLEHDTRLSSLEESEGRRELNVMNEVGEKTEFPLKQILNMEFTWYTSPEEAEGGQSIFASDIYKLGILLFELFCMFDNLEEKFGIMCNLRHRVLPPRMLIKWPKVASFCMWLLHPQPSSRPKMSEVLQSEFLNEKRDSLEEREAVIRLKEEIEKQDLLLEFLLQLQTRKHDAADKLHDTICFLARDIEEVKNERSVLFKEDSSFFGVNKDGFLSVDNISCSLPYDDKNEPSASLCSRKRIKSEYVEFNEHKIISKGFQMMKNFNKLEAAYLSSRFKTTIPERRVVSSKLQVIDSSRGSTAKTEGSSLDDLNFKEGLFRSSSDEWINPFLEGLNKYLSFSKFNVRAELKQGDLLNSSNLICSLAFDRDKQFFATVGVNRKIKVFEFDVILNDGRDIHYPVMEMSSRARLSNVCWNGYIKNQLASSDFEGVVQLWDVTRSQALVEMREHEKRVWSIDCSLMDPTKLASGSDDGTVKLWNINQEGSTNTIRTNANVCSVQFPPDSAQFIAVGSADHNIYYYDLRNVRVPLCTLVGHAKTVSYVKFADSSTLVSSSTDNSMKLWDLSASASRVLDSTIQTFTGHTNVKSFVGLSISDGYIATGSETNEVFVYQKAFPMPVFSYNFGSMDPISGLESDDANQFISCVCWHGEFPVLVAANSSGIIKLLEMV